MLQAARKQTLRFDIELEIGLFKEVINVNPYVSEGQDLTEAWRKVGENTTLASGGGYENECPYCKTKN